MQSHKNSRWFFFFLNWWAVSKMCVVEWGGRWEGVSKERGYMYTLEKAMPPHSSTLAWKIPWTEEPGRLQSMGSLRVGHDWLTSLSLFSFMHWRRKWQPTPVFLLGEFQGRGSLVGCCLWDRRVGHDWSDAAAAAAAAAYVYLWLIHVEVWQKTAKFCKAIIFQ